MNLTVPRAMAALLAFAAASGSAVAQGASRFGVHAGYQFDFDDAVVGAQAAWPIASRLEFYPSFDYYLVDAGSLWALNADLKFRPPTRRGAFYFGGGLNYLNGGGGGDTNLNLLAGLERRRRGTRPYLEAKLVLGGGNAFQLVGGFSW